METFLLVVLNVSTAILFGGMFAFTGFFAPLAFSRLPEEQSGQFVQGIFPIYYVAGTVLAGIGAFSALGAMRQPEAIILWRVALGFLFSRYYLMPRTITAREQRERGEMGAAERFADLHKRAAFMNMVQLICCLVVLVRIVM